MASRRSPIETTTGSLARSWCEMDEASATRWALSPSRGLIIPGPMYHQMMRFLHDCLPMEGVGLLAVDDCAESVIARRFYPGRNTDASPVRYTMHASDVLAALQAMERRRTWLGAIVHSHPCTPPVPSETDRVEAALPGVLSVIVSLREPVTARAWRFEFDQQGSARRSVEVPLVVDSHRGATLLTTSVKSDAGRPWARLTERPVVR
jgi:proteasome lid subunit RPN8/RPN11